jgi:hypothetical protein
MTRARNRGWADDAVPVDGGRAYPLVDLPGWRDAVVDELGHLQNASGIDLGLLGIWLGRTSGITVAGATPTRDELVTFALERLGLPTDRSHVLCQSTPPILAADGDDTWAPTHFGTVALTLDEIAELCETVDPQAPQMPGHGNPPFAFRPRRGHRR